MRERFHFLFDVEQMAEDGETFLQDGAPGKRHAVLRKIAGGRSLGGEKGSVVERLDARQHFQQRRFAGAVAADQADALPLLTTQLRPSKRVFEPKCFPADES